jgi:hypothetical protein
MTEAKPDLITCPACQGWGALLEGKTGTVPCAFCQGEGQVEARENAPALPIIVCLAVMLCLVVLGVYLLDAIVGTP